MLSVVKTNEQRTACELRAQGRSIREIERALGVSRSSVSGWVRHIQLKEEEQVALAARVGQGRLEAAARKSDAARLLRAQFQADGRERARNSTSSYAMGCMLYWAEGTKSRWSASMSNSDCDLLRLFAEFLRVHFEVSDESMRVHCHLFADHAVRQREIEKHWLTTLALPESCLRKTIVNAYSKYSSKKRTNKLPFGTSKLSVHSTKIVHTILGSIQEYGAFDRPEWLG
jgi:DNA-binding transcriptional ArsR family regulator